MRKYITQICLFLSVLIVSVNSVSATSKEPIYFFYGDGCPHCAQVEVYFEKKGLYEKYNIDSREIYFNGDNAVLFNNLLDKNSIPQHERGVPAVIMGNTVITGDTPIIQRFENEAQLYLNTGSVSKAQSNTEIASIEQNSEFENQTEEGTNSISKLTILAVIGGALVDAINPCAFAVLIILMTTILAGGSKNKALFSGLAFSASIFISYFLMGLGVYKALGMGSAARVFYQVVGWLAILLGLLNFKDFFWYGKGILMEVPLSWRPHMKKLISSVTNPIGAFFIGFLVSLFLLPCTSGPYIVILGMLAKNTLTAKALGYLVLYNLIFITPMIIITAAVYSGYSVKKAESIRQNHLRTLHLIAGTVLVAMGIAIVSGLF